MIYILYITTQISTNKVYIGIHKQNEPYEFDGYFGSGNVLKSAIKKYGISDFKRETLMYFFDENLAYLKEQEIVNKAFVKANWNFNTKIGGHHQNFIRVKPFSEEHRKNLSLSAKGNRNSINNIPPKVDWNGRKHSEESKRKMSEAQKNRFKTQEHPKGMKGKTFKMSEESKNKIRLSKIVINTEGDSK